MVSVVLNGLLPIPSILFPACAITEGEIVSRRPRPIAAAAPVRAAPARNFRRLRYRFFGVISDERMSGAFLISISPHSLISPSGEAQGQRLSRTTLLT